MGIQSRDYYRDAHSRRPGWLTGAPAVQWIITINCIVFVLQLLTVPPNHEESLVDAWLALDPNAVAHGEIWRLVTYAFLHNRYSLLHLVFNMLALWFFGRALEPLYGSREFVWFYLVAALVGGIGFTIWGFTLGLPHLVVGASGAVMAVFMLFARHYPHEKVCIFGLICIEAQWLVWLYAAFDLYPVLLELGGGAIGDQIAHVVHLSGLAFGWAYYRFGWRLSSGWSGLSDAIALRWRRATGGRKLKVYQPQPEEEPENFEAEVDRVLAKIHDHGSESLDDRERKLLQRASERYKHRD